MSLSAPIFDRKNPYQAKIKERYSLCHPSSPKNTYHLVLDLKDSSLTYQVGDSVAIFPQHDPLLVDHTLDALRASGDELIIDKRTQLTLSLRTFLRTKAAITTVSRKLFTETAKKHPDPAKAATLTALLENAPQLKEYLEKTDLGTFLKEHAEVKWECQDLCDHLMPLLPRFYSISSSMKAVGEEMHLTVAIPAYADPFQRALGVCTHYLCHLAIVGETNIPLYIQPHHGFTLPENSASPVIMVGPGTGIAPFRAFMQEREMLKAPGKNWLFFGEWNRSHHFFYEDYWRELENSGKLRINAAFSRDQEHKVYVQHHLEAHGAEIFNWIESGASFFVCGDAHKMAKDVESTLLSIFRLHGNFSEIEADKYLKALRVSKRYLRDVY
jgi:sulfite reductase (NADPH) flavoprotein alpha-component